MSNEFVNNVTIDSFVIDNDEKIYEEPQQVELDRVDFNASLIRNGEVPASADSKLVEMDSHIKLASQLTEMIDEFLTEHRTSTERQADSIQAYGDQYQGRARRILDEIQRLQESVVDFLVNSTHDSQIQLKIEQLSKEVSDKLKELYQIKEDVYTDRHNYQADWARLQRTSNFRASQQKDYVEKIRDKIGIIEADPQPQPQTPNIDSLEDYVNADSSQGVERQSVSALRQSTELSAEELARAQEACPDDLVKYQQALEEVAAVEREQNLLKSKDRNSKARHDQVVAEIEKYQGYRHDLNAQAAAAEQHLEKYLEKTQQMEQMLGMLKANTKLKSDYDEGLELAQHPTISEVYTTRLESRLSRHTDETLLEVSRRFAEELATGKLPDAAEGNPRADGILTASKLLASLESQYQEIASQIDSDTRGKVQELEGSHLQIATMLNRHLDKINGESGISQYLLDLAISYNELLEQQRTDRSQKADLEIMVRDLNQAIEKSEAAIVSAVDNVDMHQSNIVSITREIEQTKADFSIQKARYMDDDYRSLIETPETHDPEDINAIYAGFEQKAHINVDSLVDGGRANRAVEDLKRRLELVRQDLAECQSSLHKLQGNLIEQTDKRSELIAKIDDISVQIMGNDSNLQRLIHDGKYEDALVSLEVAVDVFQGIQSDNPIEKATDVVESQPLAVEQVNLLEEPELGVEMGFDDMYYESPVRQVDMEHDRVKAMAFGAGIIDRIKGIGSKDSMGMDKSGVEL